MRRNCLYILEMRLRLRRILFLNQDRFSIATDPPAQELLTMGEWKQSLTPDQMVRRNRAGPV